jgi:dGTPase
MLAWQVTDLLDETARRLSEGGIRSTEAVRVAAVPLVGLSKGLAKLKAGLEGFLRDRVYRHHFVLRMTASGKRVLKALFDEYVRCPELLPERHLRRWSGVGGVTGPQVSPPLPGRATVPSLERVVGDYLAGMTDRFAQQEYRRLFHPSLDL